jgi:hypothetical protein
MKPLQFLVIGSFLVFFYRWTDKTIHGNGKIVTQNGAVQKTGKIEFSVNFEVGIIQTHKSRRCIETDVNALITKLNFI